MGSSGVNRLRDVGIYLSHQELNQALEALTSLRIPLDIALRHRYWDPFDLELLYLESQSGSLDPLPSNPWEAGISDYLFRIVSFHAERLKYYYDRTIRGASEERLIWAISLSAEQWAREKLLREILDKRNFVEKVADKIEDQIHLLMTKVTFGLPALLKPYVDITGQGSALLSSIEWGAFHPVTRLLIERGLARDTAISTRRDLLADLTGEEADFDVVVCSRLSDRLEEFSEWEQGQIVDAFLS